MNGGKTGAPPEAWSRSGYPEDTRHQRIWLLCSLMALLLVGGGMVVAWVGRYAANAALARAIEYGDAPRARQLLRRGADARTLAWDQGNLLALAARTNDLPLLEEGLARGLDVEAVDLNGMTPLMWASARGWVAGAEALLKAGANARRVAIGGMTPLSLSTSTGYSVTYGTRLYFRQPSPHPGFARVTRLLKQHGAR